MTASARQFGFELEYASNTDAMNQILYNAGLTGSDHRHDYHCRCEVCSFGPSERYDPSDGVYRMMDPFDVRYQRDSTADGEFITRILNDWDDLRRIANAITAAASQAEASTSARCGLHVHVDTIMHDMGKDERDTSARIVPAAYLAFERYFTEIVAPGASVRKREMNSTLMESVRGFVVDNYAGNNGWLDMGRAEVDRMMLQAITRDRHVDLNWSRTHRTWEFRVFNATNAPWRIELACRMAVAFVEAAPALRHEVESQVRGSRYWPEECDSPWGEIVRPAWSDLSAPHPTKKPVVPMERFIDILCDVDPDLRPLIERQANYMLARFARQVEVAA